MHTNGLRRKHNCFGVRTFNEKISVLARASGFVPASLPIASRREFSETHDTFRPTLLAVPRIYLFAARAQTDSDAIQPLQPDRFRPAEKPTVTIWFGCNNRVDFIADRGYRQTDRLV